MLKRPEVACPCELRTGRVKAPGPELSSATSEARQLPLLVAPRPDAGRRRLGEEGVSPLTYSWGRVVAHLPFLHRNPEPLRSPLPVSASFSVRMAPGPELQG